MGHRYRVAGPGPGLRPDRDAAAGPAGARAARCGDARAGRQGGAHRTGDGRLAVGRLRPGGLAGLGLADRATRGPDPPGLARGQRQHQRRNHRRRRRPHRRRTGAAQARGGGDRAGRQRRPARPAAGAEPGQSGAHDRHRAGRQGAGAADRHAHAAESGPRIHPGLRAQLRRTGATPWRRAAAVPAGTDRTGSPGLPGRQPASGGERAAQAARSRMDQAGAVAALCWRRRGLGGGRRPPALPTSGPRRPRHPPLPQEMPGPSRGVGRARPPRLLSCAADPAATTA